MVIVYICLLSTNFNKFDWIQTNTECILQTQWFLHVNPLRSGFCVQWEWAHSTFTPGSTDSAADAGFSHLTLARLGSAVNVNLRPLWTLELLLYFPVFLMDFKIAEVNTNGHRAENDSCLTCDSISTVRFRWYKLKLTAQCDALSLVKSQPRSPSTPLSLHAINLSKQ